jgi:hypothetical protein
LHELRGYIMKDITSDPGIKIVTTPEYALEKPKT